MIIDMDITLVVQALIALNMAVITTIVLPKVKEWLDERTTKADCENNIELVRMAVNAAEQLYQPQTVKSLEPSKENPSWRYWQSRI